MRIIKNHLGQLIGIELLFILTTYLFFAVIWYTKIYPFDADLIFHIRRINELANDLRHLQMPMFNQYVGMPMGVATLTFYPWLNILPISLLLLLHVPPVQALLIGFSLLFFIGLNIAYGSCLSFIKNKALSLLFTYFYCISTVTLCLYYTISDLGETSAYFCIPLVFFGWLAWIHYGKWKMMAIGLILIIYCHIVTSILMIVFLIILSALFINKLTKDRMINGIKAIFIVILITSYIWIPILILGLSNNITMTGGFKPYGFIKNGGLFYKPFSLLLPTQLKDWTFSDIIALFIGVALWKHMNIDNKKLLGYATTILLFTSNIKGLDPIVLFENTPLMIIQNATRLVLIYHVIFTYLFIQELRYLLNNSKIKKLLKLLIIGSIAVFSIYCFLGTIENDVFLGVRLKPMLTELRFHNHDITFKINKASLDDRVLYCGHDLTGSKYDYAPNIIKKMGICSHMSVQHPNIYYSNHNVYVHSKKSHKSVKIPYILYNQQNYKISARDHKSGICREAHTFKIIDAHKGWNRIKVMTPIMWYRWFALILSILGIVIFGIDIIKNQ